MSLGTAAMAACTVTGALLWHNAVITQKNRELSFDIYGAAIVSFARKDAIEPEEVEFLGASAEAGNVDAMLLLADCYPSIDGSTVCVPLAMEMARQWLDLKEEDLNGFVNFSTTPYAYDRLFHKKPNPMVTIISQGVMMDDTHPVDLVLGTGPNADERQEAQEAGVELVMVPVCYDAFVFLVNDNNPVETLTKEEIRGIYTGYIRAWSQVGGAEDLLIAAYQRPHGSGSQTAMEEMVMDGYQLVADPNYISDGMSDLIEQIGNYDNSLNAIGYSYLYYVNSLYREGQLKILSVDGIAPTEENLQNESYPYTVYYYAVYEKGNEIASRFVEWMTSDEGQACVQQAGYVPLRKLQK
ncbi:MAG: substrate-binding domain-containing protein [Clostridia bacterium]|nr:substrate-binding domain-containing protein [Clostridia bacterium]